MSASLTACAGSPGRQVVNVAQQDLGCDKVEIDEISDNRYAAYGCGRGAVYAQICAPGTRTCTWGRLRHGHESAPGMQDTAAAAAAQPAPPRQIIAAPAPEAREVIPAPAPQPREIIPAPPPASSGGEAAAPAAPTATEGDANAPAGAAPATTNPQAPVPLSQGDLSQPYQTNVPSEQYTQRSEQPPPTPLVETRPPMPAPNYIWVGGYWWWNSPSWVWAPGYWCAPRIGFTYLPGSWYWSSGYWWYGPGGWAYPGSTVIVHRVAPRPATYATVRSFTPHHVVAGPASPRAGVAPRMGNNGFRPSNSPLYRYPSSAGAAPRASVTSRPGGIGQVVQPGHSVPRISGPSSRGAFSSNGYRSSSFNNAPPRVSQPRGLSSGTLNYATPRSYGSYSPPRSSYSAPRMSSPSYSAPRMSSPSYSAPRMSSPSYSAPRMSAPSHGGGTRSGGGFHGGRGGGGGRR